MNQSEHTFAICAHKESPYLRECLESLKKQSIKSNILVATSTPNPYIENLAKEYGAAYFVNNGEAGITQDWNFAYACAKSKYVTITHQDDVYEPEYAQKVLEMMEGAKRPLIFFCDYYEIREGKKTEENRLLAIKRYMLAPLRMRMLRGSKWTRRRILSLGSPICCPSVAFAKENLPQVVFQNHFKACEDWEAWEELSKRRGEFLYAPQRLMGHRIHPEAETSILIENNTRTREEYQMFCKFWPAWFARILTRQYAKGQKSNEL